MDYLDKELFLEHINESKKLGYCTDSLAKDFIFMIDKLQKSRWFKNYHFDILEDMKSNALMKCVKNFNKFDESKAQPFTYFTRVMFNACYDIYHQYRKYWDLKNNIRQDMIEKFLSDNPGMKLYSDNERGD